MEETLKVSAGVIKLPDIVCETGAPNIILENGTPELSACLVNLSAFIIDEIVTWALGGFQL